MGHVSARTVEQSSSMVMREERRSRMPSRCLELTWKSLSTSRMTGESSMCRMKMPFTTATLAMVWRGPFIALT